MSAARRAAGVLAPALMVAASACADPSPAPTEPEGPAALVMPGGCPGPSLKVEDVQACVTLDAVRAHQAVFQQLADAHGGDRFATETGYFLSADYVTSRLRGAGYEVTMHALTAFTFLVFGPSILEQTAPAAQVYTEASDFELMAFSPRGDVTAPVTAVDLSLGSAQSTSGCEASDFAGFTTGHVALLQRGDCTFRVKAENAAAAGAVAVVIFNSFGVAGPVNGTLTSDYGGGIAVHGATYARGEEWAGTPGLVMHLVSDTETREQDVHNVIAESRLGDPGNVVVVGGHLDSAPGSPGINDNGSGAAAILETALQLAGANTRNRLRFAFWTAHELDLLGSAAYVNSLSSIELEAIALYLDFHMLGSPNGGRFVLDGDGSGTLGGGAGAAAIEAFFGDFYAGRGLEVEPTILSGRSDYDAFAAAGIPVGGLTAGSDAIKTPEQAARFGGSAGVAFDPCYHQVCDTFANVNLAALDVNSDAVAAAVLTFAMNTEAVNGVKGKGRFKAPKVPQTTGAQDVM